MSLTTFTLSEAPLSPSMHRQTNDDYEQLTYDLHRTTLESTTRHEGTSRQVDSDSEEFNDHDDFRSEEVCEAFADAAAELLHSKSPSQTNTRAFVVFKGRRPGVYETWDACEDQITGFKHNSFRGYPTLQQAQDAWNRALAARTTGPPGSSAAHLASLRTPPANRTSRPPASAGRLAAIAEGLRLKDEPNPSYRPASTPLSPTPKGASVRWASDDASFDQPVPQVDNGVPFMNDKSQWYAVIEGRNPGIYKGRSAATRAVGRGVQGCLRIGPTELEANGIFVKNYMESRVKRVE
ncbi:hypothetical protein H0H92_002383 [Tricholoma furcatifolium]|nr:hypothetical protein H0H92_002383 [Tricholoma furcatifolium]